jgi:hypothetical protein
MKAHARKIFLVFAVLIVSGIATAAHTPSQKHLKRSFCLQQCAAEIAATCVPHHGFHRCRGTLIRKCQHRAPGVCTTTTTTTTTPGPSSTTTTTAPPRAGTVKGALASTPGRFNFNAMLGLPGANAACNTNFAGTHACTYQELQSAAAAGDLKGLKDVTAKTVTSFWAIDSSAPPLQQCNDDVSSHLNWEYATAHTASRGEQVALDNAAGTLGALQTGVQCNFGGSGPQSAWVACCQ